MKILHLDAGITPNSISRQISAAVVDALKASGRASHIVYRDLAADPIPHLDLAGLATLGQDEVLEEFLEADLIVVGAPMYNFGVPSQLKAWLDRILVAGRTFRYTENGPKGLAGGKTVIVASSRGGVFTNPAMEGLDFQERYLRAAFGLTGIEAVTFIRAEGVAISPAHREAAIAAALDGVASAVEEAVPSLAA
jgi:FMN-dependent NADH-azoreductase